MYEHYGQDPDFNNLTSKSILQAPQDVSQKEWKRIGATVIGTMNKYLTAAEKPWPNLLLREMLKEDPDCLSEPMFGIAPKSNNRIEQREIIISPPAMRMCQEVVTRLTKVIAKNLP